MANVNRRLKENADGLFFVDSTCINCGVSRHYAPELFGDSGDHAYVKRQPHDAAEQLQAGRALLACPVAAIGTTRKLDLTPARASLPLELASEVYVNGFNHSRSYGAHSYFIRAASGNWLIDSPRYTAHLVERFESLGGIRYIFLSHSDDVADADRYAARFGAERIIHAQEAQVQPDAERILEGNVFEPIGDARVIFTPGHTAGHCVLLWQERYLFSGDHFAWIPRLDRFASFRQACWYSWDEQIRSVAKLRDCRRVEWVLPGHGRWGAVPAGQFPQIIDAAVQWMQTSPEPGMMTGGAVGGEMVIVLMIIKQLYLKKIKNSHKIRMTSKPRGHHKPDWT